MSVNTFVCWFWTLVVSILTPVLFKAVEGYTWLVFGVTAAIGLMYISICMKETKGVPKEQLKKLYRPKQTAEKEPLLINR